MVVTSFSIKLVLHKLEISGCLVKWAVELEEYYVIFRPTTTIKSQILAEFVVEFSPTLLLALEQEVRLQSERKEEGEWIMHVDRKNGLKDCEVQLQSNQQRKRV